MSASGRAALARLMFALVALALGAMIVSLGVTAAGVEAGGKGSLGDPFGPSPPPESQPVPSVSTSPLQPHAPDTSTVESLSPVAPYPGVYGFNDKYHLDPAIYPIYGGHRAFRWYDVEPWVDDGYQWRLIEDWIKTETALGKPVGIGINSYNGICCGGDLTPPWVYNEAPDAELLCHQEWSIPRYHHQSWLAAWEDLIHDFAALYDGDPRLAWVEISTGMYGENWPGDSYWHNGCLEQDGLTSALWLQTMKQIVDIYDAAFSQTPLMLQFAPFYKLITERRDISEYAALKGIGLKHNGLWPDTDGAIIDDPGKTYYRSGQYDPFVLWGGQVLTGWEGQEYQLMGDVGTLWGVYNALDKHADYILLGQEITTNDSRRSMLEFAQTYLGRTVEDTVSVWVALREHDPNWLGKPEWFPERGNYDFWLYQLDDAPGGQTVPEWGVGEQPEGRWTRRTDQSRGQRYMVFDVEDGYFFDGGQGDGVRVEVTYYDHGWDRWQLVYDAADDVYGQGGVIQKGDSDQWLTRSFTLEDALFANRQAGGGDFRLDCMGDGDEVVHLVKVTKLPERMVPPLVVPPTPSVPLLPPLPPLAEVILQQGLDGYAGTQDATIISWSDTPQPDGPELKLRSDRNGPEDSFTAINANHSVLMRFDLTHLPDGMIVQDATLNLHSVDRSLDDRIRVSAYQVLRPWDEAEATWTRPLVGRWWSEPGANGAEADRSERRTDVALMDETGIWYDFQVTPLVQDWIDHPAGNHGLLLREISIKNLSHSFASSEHPSVEIRPQLIITYTMPAWLTPSPTATATASPTPSSTLTPTSTPSPTPSTSPSSSPTPSLTPTATLTPTSTRTGPPHTATATPSSTPDPTDMFLRLYLPLLHVPM